MEGYVYSSSFRMRLGTDRISGSSISIPYEYDTAGMQQGDVQKAEQLIARATGANGLSEVLGNLHLAQGKYAQAEQDFGKLATNSAALAQLLNKNYAAAATTLANVKNADAITDYLKAIVNARQGNTSAAAQALAAAVAKDASLRAYAEKDLELTNVQK